MADPRLAPARWYRLDGGDQVGPVGLEEMRRLVLRGDVAPDTFVWSDGMNDWLPARRVPALVPPRSLRSGESAWPPPGP